MKQKIKLIFCIVSVLVFATCFSGAIVAYATDDQNVGNINCQLYYYNQLTDLEKVIYNNLEKSKESFLNNEKVSYVIDHYSNNTAINKQYYEEAAERARKAYSLDDAKALIWLKDYKFYLKYEDNLASMSIEPKSATKGYADISVGEIREELEKFEKKAQDFAQTLQGSDTEKLKKIHDWLMQIADYDKTDKLPNTRDAYGAIMRGKAVCTGFAYAYKYIADLANLKVLYVTGYAYDDVTKTYPLHAWNIALVNKKWVLVDVTFDETGNNKTRFLLSPLNDGIHYMNQEFIYPKN